MSDPTLQATGQELGYEGIDFYLAGRAGVLGQVGPGVAVSALCFFSPDVIVPAWERTEPLLPRRAVGEAFAACAAGWADAHLPPAAEWGALVELATVVYEHSPVVGAPLFAGWRSLPVPTDPRRAAVHLCNGLREHRMAAHAAALLIAGLDVADAVRFRSPDLAHHFGWRGEMVDAESVERRWIEAEHATDAAVGRVYEVLTATERAEFERRMRAAARSIS